MKGELNVCIKAKKKKKTLIINFYASAPMFTNDALKWHYRKSKVKKWKASVKENCLHCLKQLTTTITNSIKKSFNRSPSASSVCLREGLI